MPAAAIAFRLNVREVTEIVLAGVGLPNGAVDDRVFITLVVICLATSVMAGPAMNVLLVRGAEAVRVC